jgi:hypothetical protein
VMTEEEAAVETVRLQIEDSGLPDKHKIVLETMLDESGVGAVKSTLCTLYGHPPVLTTCFGYEYCARCGEQLGDSLGGIGTSQGKMVVGHSCAVCDSVRAGLTEAQSLLTQLEPDT